jgi:hypothetical protein
MMLSTLKIPNPNNNYHSEHVAMVLVNLKQLMGFYPIQKYGFSLDNLGSQVFHADFCLLSHNSDRDPILNYGNQRVLDLSVRWLKVLALPLG